MKRISLESLGYDWLCVFYYVTVMDIDIIKLIISQCSKRVRLRCILGFALEALGWILNIIA